MLFVTLIVIIGLLGLVRLLALCMRTEWRSDLGDNFPDACGEWAKSNGCTRIEVENDQCTRPDKIVSENSIIFPAGPNQTPSELGTIIE